MTIIHGITVKLSVTEQIGTDGFNRPVYQEGYIDVENVLVQPMSDEEVLDTLNLTGKKAKYKLGIPKGDTHDWSTGKTVRFFEEEWRIIGKPLQGIEALIPLDWNKQVKVESVNVQD